MKLNTKMFLFFLTTLFVLLSMVSGLSKKALNRVMNKKMEPVSLLVVFLHVVVLGLFVKALVQKRNVSKFTNDDKKLAEELYSHNPLV
jgi:hypothetical protein